MKASENISGFSIVPKVTLAQGLRQPGTETPTFRLVADLVYLLHYSHPQSLLLYFQSKLFLHFYYCNYGFYPVACKGGPLHRFINYTGCDCGVWFITCDLGTCACVSASETATVWQYCLSSCVFFFLNKSAKWVKSNTPLILFKAKKVLSCMIFFWSSIKEQQQNVHSANAVFCSRL